jgi:hypothetical protein
MNNPLLKLLEEWLETPFFSDEHDWEDWAYPFSRRVETAIAAAKGETGKECYEVGTQLLEACEMALIIVGNELYEAKESFQSETYIEELQRCYDKLNAAIAAAKGESGKEDNPDSEVES